MNRVVAALAAVVLGLGVAAPEAAADDEARARELTASGQRHYDVGEYDEAIEAYREAYRLTPRPGLIFNLAQAFRLKGDCLTATRMYRNYLRLEPDTKHRALVNDHLAALAACATEREAAGARAAADEGSEPEAAPPVAEPSVAEPPREEPVAGPESRPGGRPGRTRKLVGLTATVAGVVVAAAGGYFALDAVSAADEVSRGYAEGAAWSELEAIDARGRRSEVIGVSLLVTGAAAVACGATLYTLGWRADRRAAHAVLVPTPGGAGIEVTWSF